MKESHLLNKMERFCRRPFSGDNFAVEARLVFSSLSPSSSRGDDRRHEDRSPAPDAASGSGVYLRKASATKVSAYPHQTYLLSPKSSFCTKQNRARGLVPLWQRPLLSKGNKFYESLHRTAAQVCDVAVCCKKFTGSL